MAAAGFVCGKFSSMRISFRRICGADLELFLNKDYWFDGVHPTGTGALLFTKWLAEQWCVEGVDR